MTADVSTQTFIDFSKLAQNFSTVASPTLYSSQKVVTKAGLAGSPRTGSQEAVTLRPYILYYDIENQVRAMYGDAVLLDETKKTFEWTVPDTKGMSIFKLGYEVAGRKRFDGDVVIYSIDWKGAPTDFALEYESALAGRLCQLRGSVCGRFQTYLLCIQCGSRWSGDDRQQGMGRLYRVINSLLQPS